MAQYEDVRDFTSDTCRDHVRLDFAVHWAIPEPCPDPAGGCFSRLGQATGIAIFDLITQGSSLTVANGWIST